MANSDSGKPPSRAEAAFADYLRRREGGEGIGFDAFLREHTDLETDLRKLERNWRRVQGIMGRLAGTDSDEFARESEPRVPPAEIHERLKGRRSPFERYRIEGEIARGGMGKVVNAWDADLRRHVAMKVALDGEKTGPSDGSGRMRRLARFLEEAQITGQLDHPGIVPVHELGLDDEGKLYFTLKLVRGRDLRAIFGLVRTGAEGWSQTRALGVLLRVCEAMAFAHERGVVHRDLKPANIMVGRHGETYVMDWGLARVLGEEDGRDLRVAESTAEAASRVGSDRFDLSHETPGSPLLTVDGEVIGTPQYMPPEQAEGDLERIGPPSDVYSLGAMLYELLAGKAPYLAGSGRVSPHAVWRWVIDGPPKPISKLALKQPAELVAICEKAMARRIEERYADMSELAEDLRAYLEHRVVRAYRTGAFVELRKWIERNKIAAALLCMLGIVIAAAGYVSAGLEHARQREREERLSRAFVEEAARSWPLDPSSVPRMQKWLEGAQDLVRALPERERELEALRSRGRELDDAELAKRLEETPVRRLIENESYFIDTMPGLIEAAKATLVSDTASNDVKEAASRLKEAFEPEVIRATHHRAELLRQFKLGQGWDFDSPELARRYSSLAEVVANLDDLARVGDGVIARVKRRLEQAAGLERRTLIDARSLWDAAIADIAARKEYLGLRLEPQIGLVPLRPHPYSGLWEFWFEPSGARPQERDDGEWMMRPETGMVLVLLPGGKFTMGAQKTDSEAENYDPDDYPAPVPIDSIELAPYFLSKYEMTQGQWERLCSERPSLYGPGDDFKDSPPITLTHPVESVCRDDASAKLSLWCLDLPTDAQWEFAARCGHGDRFGGFLEFKNLPPQTNVKDLTFVKALRDNDYEQDWNDGWVIHGPVDRMEAGEWGFFGVFGNVSELTRDITNASGGYASKVEPRKLVEGTGEHRVKYGNMGTAKGGNWRDVGSYSRVATRLSIGCKGMDPRIGIRPCRSVVP